MTNWYIKTGFQWLNDAPKEWKIYRVKNLFSISKEKNQGEDIDVLSLTQKGIIRRDISTNEGQIASSYENYTRIRVGDLVLNPMDLQTGFVDASLHEGVISLAYTVLRPLSKSKVFTDYYKYYFQWHYYQKILFNFGQGVSPAHRWTLKDEVLLNFPILCPPIEVQKETAHFLEKKLEIIQKILSFAEIEKLKEYRSSLIYHAVTGKIKI